MDIAKRQMWLKLAATVTILFGLLTAAGAAIALQGPTVWLADLLVWPLDGLQGGRDPTARLMFAISGGVLAGWGALMWMVADRVMGAMPDVARRMVITSAVTWFAVDSSASVLAGAPVNVVANLGFLAMYLVPMMAVQQNPAKA